MKDLVPKGTGNSRFLRSVSNFLSLYPNYEAFVAALVAGTLPVDFAGINTNGVTQVGTALTKANLLTDATATALGLSGDPTVNDALYALSQMGSPAECHVYADSGTTVTMTKGSKTLTAVAGSNKQAVLYPSELGSWNVKRTWKGSTKTVSFTVEVIGIVYCYPFTVGRDLESTSWADISTISELGMAQKYFQVGDTKTIKVNGVNYQVRIIGFNHDNLTSGGKAGITFQMVDCLTTTYNMESSSTNANGWLNCAMRKTHLRTTIWGQLESSLKSVIKTVNKLASAGNQSATIQTAQDTLFLLSEVEIFGKVTYSKAGEGTQYAYYAAGNSTIKKLIGSAYYWWERSPRGSNATHFCSVNSNGGADSDGATDANGVAFGFCV